MTTIYVLLDNDQVRYIGKTQKTDLREKLEQHMDESLVNPGKLRWLENLSRQGKKPEILPVFTCKDCEAEYYETLFIKEFKHFSKGKLTNIQSLISGI